MLYTLHLGADNILEKRAIEIKRMSRRTVQESVQFKGMVYRKNLRQRQIVESCSGTSLGSFSVFLVLSLAKLMNDRHFSLVAGFQPNMGCLIRGEVEWRNGSSENCRQGLHMEENVQSVAVKIGGFPRIVSLKATEKNVLDPGSSKRKTVGHSFVTKAKRQDPLNNSNEESRKNPSYDTALCIVPEDSAWDAIQRARHMTGDKTLYVWPPCIRLFHPFVSPSDLSNVALDVASNYVEKYEVTRFKIALSDFVILPWYALDQNGMVISSFRQQVSNRKDAGKRSKINESEKNVSKTKVEAIVKEDMAKGHYDSRDGKSMGIEAQRKLEYDKIQNLIASEERIGKEKLLKRQMREGKLNKSVADKNDGLDSKGNAVELRRSSTKKEKYNGPCILCLEPNEESRQELKKLRDLLRKELFPSLKSIDISASTVPAQRLYPASEVEKRPKPPPYRPAITLGRFSTVEEARECKKRLQETWEPLTFSATDLHLLCRAGKEPTETNPGSSSSSNAHRRDTAPRATDTAPRSNQSTKPFNCDSIVYFVGEESGEAPEINAGEQNISFNKDDEDVDGMMELMLKDDSEEGTIINLDEIFAAKRWEAKEKAKLLMNEASGKRAKRRRRRKELKMPEGVEVVEPDMDELLSSLLPEVEEDWNEGATIMIGRTQFFLGEMREYVGMPASRSMDLKDGASGVSSASKEPTKRGRKS